MTESTVTQRLSLNELTSRVEAVLRRAGLNDEHVRAVSRVIVAGERDGAKAHGIHRLETCLSSLRARKVVPDAPVTIEDDKSSVIRVSANGGFACAALERGTPLLAERTQTAGVAALVVNDAAHFSALWYEIEALTSFGVAALAMCPNYATVAPAGGHRPLLGTNPFAFGWPRTGRTPYVFDLATSVAARGELELRRRRGQDLPHGWAVGPDGSPTTDPATALVGAMLPFGGHKGSAIATMIELLAGPLIGDRTSVQALSAIGDTALVPTHGELIIAFDLDRLSRGRDAESAAERLFEAIVDQNARLPSERRFQARSVSVSQGVSLTDEELSRLHDLAAEDL